jgi:hypothetical protein
MSGGVVAAKCCCRNEMIADSTAKLLSLAHFLLTYYSYMGIIPIRMSSVNKNTELT